MFNIKTTLCSKQAHVIIELPVCDEYYDQQFYIFRILVNLSSVVPFTKKKQQPKQKIYLEV
ncbi:hypothetical protein T4B_8456 [Trichinella pseudospiralis]|uniref:Uncharacterized protein n=1 Tax=Trichinella pseudospiralis TaxID=6337 RepID=A0A0V1JCY0_TRIPS|nr:hypothetical protein T4B_8456 [Trichinella pseudospiralis]KRZ46356.1 hypothetical protein T4C_8679 [Trichinella pseudospiralis]